MSLSSFERSGMGKSFELNLYQDFEKRIEEMKIQKPVLWGPKNVRSGNSLCSTAKSGSDANTEFSSERVITGTLLELWGKLKRTLSFLKANRKNGASVLRVKTPRDN